MKKPGVFMVSMAAASATAISASASSTSPDFFGNSKIQASQQEVGSNDDRENSSSRKSMTSTEKFAPRFDGLRFIETLVTAHR